MFTCTRETHQHQVDVEAEYLVAHVHAEVVAVMISQVGEGPRRALEVRAGHLHTLEKQQRVREGQRGGDTSEGLWMTPPAGERRLSILYEDEKCIKCVCVCVCEHLLRYSVVHGSQHRVQSSYKE